MAAGCLFSKCPKPPFNKDGILHTVLSLAAPNRVPAIFGDATIAQQWREWHKTTPTTLEEVPAAARLKQIAMPMRCDLPKEELAPTVDKSIKQVELLSYSNGGDGRTLSAKELERTAVAVLTSALTTDDLPVNSTVAIAAPPVRKDAPVGERTPFLVADVLQVELDGTSPAVSRILVHYRMPYAGTKCCDNPAKAWHLACLCRQIHDKNHERYRVCKDLMANAPVSAVLGSTRFVDWVEPSAVLETKLQFTGKLLHLDAATKRRLVEDFPGNADLAAQLGVKRKQTATQAKALAQKASRMSMGPAFT